MATPTLPGGAPARRLLHCAIIACTAAFGSGLAGPPAGAAPLSGVPAAPAHEVSTVTVEPGIVRIDTSLAVQGAVGAGTGVVLTPDGVVLTNNHVIRGATDIKATNVGNGQTYAVDVLGYDRKSDIAVLQLRGAGDLPVVPTGDSTTVRVGDPVTGAGFAGGRGLSRAPGEVRALDQGIVANDDLTGSSEQLTGLIEFAADIEAGDSGGPLVDRDGRVVGIVTAASKTYRMTTVGGFAIPVNQALGVSDSIRSGVATGSVHVGPTGILGLGVAGSGDGRGVPVQGVLRGSPAEAAGITGGDVIVAIDGAQVPDATALTDVLDRHHPGDSVTVTYLDRQRASRDVPVTLVPGPPN